MAKAKGFTDEDGALLEELGIEVEATKQTGRTARDERVIAGFEEIQRFVDQHGHAPQHGEGRDIFERLYAVRLDRLRELPDCRAVIEPLDRQGLLAGAAPTPVADTDELDDDALLAELGVDTAEDGIAQLKHVRSAADKRAAEEIANREKCEGFDKFKPLFAKVKQEIVEGTRQTRPFELKAEIRPGAWFIVGGQMAYVADMGEIFSNAQGRTDARLRVIFDNGTEGNLLMRSLQRALHKDEAGRRITDPVAGPLFAGESEDGDHETGTIYVLRSKSDDPQIAASRDVLHKIGVTGGKVETRIANAKLDPTFLLADVEIVATYKLSNINRTKLENLIHRIFDPARLNIEIKDRFGNPVIPREWFLVPVFVTQATRQAVHDYRARVAEVAALSERLVGTNARLAIVKEQAAADDLSALGTDLAKLRAQKARYEPEILPHCDNYLTEKAAKTATEALRAQARAALDQYRQQIYPAFEAAINDCLRRFGASFRLGEIQSVNTRAGSSASYVVVINQQNVDVTAEAGPSFRNTLSAGDRNTLALAFFFASMEQDPNLANKIVVIDDPMTSLDDHRTLRTREEIMALTARVRQVIVLSHSKPFLCSLWEQADRNASISLRINRAAVGSEIALWDVRNDSISEHDKRHELVRAYLQVADPAKEREVAQALRPILESFMRVAYPEHFPPETLLGPFIGICEQRVGGPNEILLAADIAELRSLLNYANRFHHDPNPAWQTAAINDAELSDFAQRTLIFASRR